MFRWCRWQVSYPDQGSKVTESLAAASQPQPPHPPPHDVALPVLTPEPDLCEHRTWPLWSGCSDHVALVSVGCRHLYTPGTQNTEPILIPSTCPIQPGNHSTLILIQKCCVKSREHTVLVTDVRDYGLILRDPFKPTNMDRHSAAEDNRSFPAFTGVPMPWATTLLGVIIACCWAR